MLANGSDIAHQRYRKILDSTKDIAERIIGSAEGNPVDRQTIDQFVFDIRVAALTMDEVRLGKRDRDSVRYKDALAQLEGVVQLSSDDKVVLGMRLADAGKWGDLVKSFCREAGLTRRGEWPWILITHPHDKA